MGLNEPGKGRGWRIGADIGGTFTDVIALGPDSRVVPAKVLSTRPDFQTGVVNGALASIEAAGVGQAQVDTVLHATTVATNAILERGGALTGLVTTAGFRDVLELGRLRRPFLYDLSWQKPAPLAARRHRFELDHRIAGDGTELRPVQEDDLEQVAARIREEGLAAVAVCLLNSYQRPDIERAVAGWLRNRLPAVYVTASVDVSPELQEFERTSTVTVNAYVGPVVRDYVDALQASLVGNGIKAPFIVMQSSGGLLDAQSVISRPVQIIESGPAAGVIAVQKLAQLMGLDNVVAFDMGGTTAKASLIEDGCPFVAADYEVGGGMNGARGLGRGAGYAVRVPSLDIAEVGAGGGSIISVDVAGALHVGPQSASSVPGPAAYGLGGTSPTLTDANVVLGYLSPHAIAGGRVAIHPGLAASAVGTIAARLSLGTQQAARGAYRVAVSNMTTAVKAVTTERGRDPRDSVMVAFGGAGPLYGAELARELGIRTVVVPMHTGLFSSLGLLVADRQLQAVAPAPAAPDPAGIGRLCGELEQSVRAELAATTEETPTVQRQLDMRYRGQRFELSATLAGGPVTEGTLAAARAAFHDEHFKTYGRRGEDSLVEIVNVRVRATIENPTSMHDVLTPFATGVSRTTRACFFDRPAETPVLSRFALTAEPQPGPLVIEDMDATTLVPPGAAAHLDQHNSIVIQWNTEE